MFDNNNISVFYKTQYMNMFMDIKKKIDLDIYNRDTIMQIFRETSEGLLDDSKRCNDCKTIKELANNVTLSYHHLNDFILAGGDVSLFKIKALSEAEKIFSLCL